MSLLGLLAPVDIQHQPDAQDNESGELASASKDKGIAIPLLLYTLQFLEGRTNAIK